MNFLLHTIYILDDITFKHINMNFLNYISRNKLLLAEMEVKVRINLLLIDQLQDPEIESFLKNNNINQFPILISGNNIYKGLQDIIKLYESNFNAFRSHKIRQMQIEQQQKIYQIKKEQEQGRGQEQRPMQGQERPMQGQGHERKQDQKKVDDDNNIKAYMDFEIGGGKKQEIEDDDNIFNMGDSGSNMMDNYRNMMERRGTSKSRTKNGPVVTTEREDNIETSDSPLNIDPTKINYDDEKDPQDDLIEQAYWARMSESK